MTQQKPPMIVLPAPQSPDPNRRPSWRARRYGWCRYHDHNVLAYFFANRFGRQLLRDRWVIKWKTRKAPSS